MVFVILLIKTRRSKEKVREELKNALIEGEKHENQDLMKKPTKERNAKTRQQSSDIMKKIIRNIKNFVALISMYY